MLLLPSEYSFRGIDPKVLEQLPRQVQIELGAWIPYKTSTSIATSERLIHDLHYCVTQGQMTFSQYADKIRELHARAHDHKMLHYKCCQLSHQREGSVIDRGYSEHTFPLWRNYRRQTPTVRRCRRRGCIVLTMLVCFSVSGFVVYGTNIINSGCIS